MNTRFAVAVHILTFLQSQRGEPATSELIASSVGTNPSLVRRLLSHLARAGLATAQRGTGGGAVLARPAQTITLLDVYRALEIGPGERSGAHRTALEPLLFDARGKGFISDEDYAVAVLDELERPQHVGRRFGIAY